MKDQPEFPALALLASRGLLACRPAMLYSSICNPPRTRQHVKRIRHEKRFSRNKSQRTPMVLQRSVEPKIQEPKTGYTLRQLWADSEPAIGQKSSPSYEVKDGDICRAVAAIADLPSSTLPDSPFILALGTPAAQNIPPQTGTLAQRAPEEWERTLCENKAVAILARDASRPTGPHPKRWRRNAYCHCP